MLIAPQWSVAGTSHKVRVGLSAAIRREWPNAHRRRPASPQRLSGVRLRDPAGTPGISNSMLYGPNHSYNLGSVELKQYTVAGKAYTLVLKQNPNAKWECVSLDPAENEVIKASVRASKRDAQFAAHVALYKLHSLRCDQKCEDDCDKNWVRIVPASQTPSTRHRAIGI